MAAKVKKQYDFFGLKRKSVTFAPICGVLHGLNRESGVNPEQFPLL